MNERSQNSTGKGCKMDAFYLAFSLFAFSASFAVIFFTERLQHWWGYHEINMEMWRLTSFAFLMIGCWGTHMCLTADLRKKGPDIMNEYSQNSTGKYRKMIAFFSTVQILGWVGTALAFLLLAISQDFFLSLGLEWWKIAYLAVLLSFLASWAQTVKCSLMIESK